MQLPLLVDGGAMVFDGSDEVPPGIEEACDYGVVFCEELDECWKNEYSWCGLMTESFNRVGTDINSDDNSLLFEWLSLLLKLQLSRVWWLKIPFGRGTMNAIWVYGGVVWLLFFCWWPKKCDSQFICAITAFMFKF